MKCPRSFSRYVLDDLEPFLHRVRIKRQWLVGKQGDVEQEILLFWRIHTALCFWYYCYWTCNELFCMRNAQVGWSVTYYTAHLSTYEISEERPQSFCHFSTVTWEFHHQSFFIVLCYMLSQKFFLLPRLPWAIQPYWSVPAKYLPMLK